MNYVKPNMFVASPNGSELYLIGGSVGKGGILNKTVKIYKVEVNSEVELIEKSSLKCERVKHCLCWYGDNSIAIIGGEDISA